MGRTGVAVAVLAIVMGACSSSSSSGVTPGAACVAAGGQCLGDVNVQCENYGSQDCGLGGLCCFDVVYDAATDAPGDSGPDSGTSDAPSGG